MIEFKLFQRQNYDKLKEMMLTFYTSEAVDEALDEEIILKLLDDILSGEYSVKGIEAYYKDSLVGFGVVTSYYSSEVAGLTIQLEDLYIESKYRSKGIAKEYFSAVRKNYSDAARFRLEVCPTNERAIKLYEELGFKTLKYSQMIIDIDDEE